MSSTPERLSELEQAAWGGFLATHAALWKAMERRLAPIGLSLTDYDVLLKLEEVGSDGLRMSDLASRLLMSSGGFTRLADRLERQGYVQRHRCETDGRGMRAVLTPAGRRVLRRARAAHLDDVRTLFLGPLSETELRRLASAWRRLQEPVASSVESGR